MINKLCTSKKIADLKQEVENEKLISFDKLPTSRGLYFIYCKKELIYIGCAYSDKRTIRIRCKQYIWRGSGGKSLRKKISSHFKWCDQELSEKIKTQCKFKCLIMPDSKKEDILLKERVYISLLKPKLND